MILVQPPQISESVRKEVVGGKNEEREREKERDGQRLSEKRSH